MDDVDLPIEQPDHAYIVPVGLLVEMMQLLVLHPYNVVAPLLAELNECEKIEQDEAVPA